MEEGNKILNNSLCLLCDICSRVEDFLSENTIRIENCVDQTQDEESIPRKYVFLKNSANYEENYFQKATEIYSG